VDRIGGAQAVEGRGMSRPLTRDEGRAWVRVTLVLNEAERKRERALALEARALHQRYLRARHKIALIEARAREIGVWDVIERAAK